MKKILFAVLFLGFMKINAQNKIELFPDDLNIKPFTANILEPRLGSLFQLGDNELRLESFEELFPGLSFLGCSTRYSL